MYEIKKILIDGLSKYPIVINSNSLCIPQILNFSLLEYSNKLFVNCMSEYQIYLSTNSACCGNYDESILLNEITKNNKKISSTSVRLPLSHLTTEKDIYEFLRVFDIIWNDLKNKKI